MKEIFLKNKKNLSLLIILFVIGSTFTSVKAVNYTNFNIDQKSNSISFEQSFSEPIFETIGENLVSVSVKEAEYNSAFQGRPMLPAFVKTFKGHSDKVYNCNFSPNGDKIASVSRDKTLKLWDIRMFNSAVNIYI